MTDWQDISTIQNPAQMPPGWWLIPSIICGALVWAYIAAGWL